MYSFFRRACFPIDKLSRLTGSAIRQRGKHLRHIALAVAVIAIGGAATASKSEASAVYTVSFKNNNQLTTQTATSTNPLSATFSTSANHTTATGTGFAGNGTLTNSIDSNRNSGNNIANGSYTSTATSAYDDIVFFDIANPTSTASAMVSVSADFTASSNEPSTALDVWGARFEMFFNLAGSVSSTGVLTYNNTTISGSLLSSMVSVTLNTPVSFSISGRLGNFITCGIPSCGGGVNINSESTVTFPTFILSTGIGVRSASLFPPSSVIPLPAALPLFLTGLAGLALIRRRQQRA